MYTDEHGYQFIEKHTDFLDPIRVYLCPSVVKTIADSWIHYSCARRVRLFRQDVEKHKED